MLMQMVVILAQYSSLRVLSKSERLLRAENFDDDASPADHEERLSCLVRYATATTGHTESSVVTIMQTTTKKVNGME